MSNPSEKNKKQKKMPLMFMPREVHCVMEVLQNKPISEITTTLEIRERTICFYVNSVKNKLDIFVQELLKAR